MQQILTGAELLRLRLRSQLLVRNGTESEIVVAPEAAVGHMLAIQGQDLPGALWSIGQRVPGSTVADVRAAFGSGAVVRCWSWRGTLHVMNSVDIAWILALVGKRVLRSTLTRRTGLGLDDRTLDQARKVAVAALSGGAGLTRSELLRLFAEAGLPDDASCGYHMLFFLGIEGTIVMGPFRDVEQEFVLAQEWLPATPDRAEDAALRELVLRYLIARGPASEADIAWWSKLPLGPIRSALAELNSKLTEFEFRVKPFWGVTEEIDGVLPTGATTGRGSSVLALPCFDEFLLGYGDRSESLTPEHAQLIVPGGNGVFKPTVVHNGRVIGLWSKKALPGRLRLSFAPFAESFPRTVLLALESETERLGMFLGLEAESQVTPSVTPL